MRSGIPSPLDGFPSPFGPQRGGAVDPILALFANGEQGAYISAWTLSSLFQDAAGTTPADTVGDSVAKAADLDGQTDNSITTANTAWRPKLAQDGSGFYYLEFDGEDDFLQSAAGVFGSALSELWVAAAVDTDNAAVRNFVVGISDGGYGG